MRRIAKFVAIVAALTALSISADLAQISGDGTAIGPTSIPILGVQLPKPTKAGLGLTSKFGTATGTYSQADTSIGVDFTDTANEGTNLQGSLMAYPGVPFTYTAVFAVMPTCDVSLSIGPAAALTGASQLLTQHCSGSFANGSIDVEDWTDTAGTFGSLNGEISTTGTERLYLQYQDDGTHSIYRASGDGVNYREIYRDTKSSGWLSGNGGYHFFGVVIAFYRSVADTAHPSGVLMVGQSMTKP